MLSSIIVALTILCAWSIVGRRLDRWHISAPLAMVLAGIAVGFATYTNLATLLDTGTAEKIASVILALVLFVDSLEVRGRHLFGSAPRQSLRLLLIGLPLSIVAGLFVGLWLFPGTYWPVVLAAVCAVIPSDLAPASSVVTDKRIPERVRDMINVESGYNDGVIAPVFIFALTLAGDRKHASSPGAALLDALPASGKAILIGVLLGAVTGALMRWSKARDATASDVMRLGVLVIPLGAYAWALQLHANGFVAAFVAGIAFRMARGEVSHSEKSLTEDAATLAGLGLWFVFGGMSVLVMYNYFSWQALVFALFALTVLRVIPVLVSLLGSGESWADRWLVVMLPARGIATVVFGLLAFNALQGKDAELQLSVMCLTVLGSIVLHGISAPFVAAHYDRRAQGVSTGNQAQS